MIRKGFTIRFWIYGLLFLYGLVDLFLIGGPFSKWVERKKGPSLAELQKGGVVATVYAQPILQRQVDLRLQEFLWLRGWSEQDLTPTQREILSAQVLEELISEHLLRIKVHHNLLPADPLLEDQLKKEFTQVQYAFGSQPVLELALQERGYLPGELSQRLLAELQQLAYLDQQVVAEVSEAEIEEWTAQQPKRTIPARREVRHLFLSTLTRSPQDAKASLETALQALRSGQKTFEQLAQERSEDPRSNKEGGYLGWLTSARLPEDFPLFELPLRQPQLVQSAMGWHLVEILAEKPAELQEINRQAAAAFLTSEKRRHGLQLYLRQLRARAVDHVRYIPRAPLPEGS